MFADGDPTWDHSQFSVLTNQQLFECRFKDTFEDELADAVIRIYDLAGKMNINLGGHVIAKLKYNQTRPIKHGKKY